MPVTKYILTLLFALLVIATANPQNEIVLTPSHNNKTIDAINTPKLLNYQGKLTNLAGNPVSDSTYAITFRLYNSQSGGSAFWTEPHVVQTNNGIFNVLLGSIIPIESIPRDGNCYLEMQINPNPPMTPRIRLVSSAYSYLAKKSDTANYALSANVQYVDSARVSTNAHKLQGKDTLSLSNKFVDEGQTNAITNIMIVDNAINSAKIQDGTIQLVDLAFSPATRPLTPPVSNTEIQDNAITSSKIQDGTILRQDVTTTFKAPYADTADYTRYLPGAIDSARVSANAHKLQGKDTIALSNKFVDENQANSITSAMIVDGNVTMAKINQAGATTGQVLKWTGSSWQPRNDSIGTGLFLPLSGGTMTGPITSTGDPAITMGKGNFGTGNINTGTMAFVAGSNNRALGDYSVVAGGGGPNQSDSNAAVGNYSTISGGSKNKSTGNYATIGGGDNNFSTGLYSTISGGKENMAFNDYVTISGGYYNLAQGLHATIGGGLYNYASGYYATVSGGSSNTANRQHATVSGGGGNIAADTGATVSGGLTNRARGRYAVVAGGGGPSQSDSNAANGNWSVVSGGSRNSASGNYATVGGGRSNSASGNYTTIGGGSFNSVSNNDATVGGGYSNSASGERATVGGGYNNSASGLDATIGGGYYNSASGEGATVDGGCYNSASGYMAIVGGGWLNSASGNYTTIGGGGGNTVSGNYATISGGGGNITSDTGATVGGGIYNRARGRYAVVAGGGGLNLSDSNAANGNWSVVSGGSRNSASGNYATVGGGRSNSASGIYAIVGGGSNNSASGNYATVGGGYSNSASYMSATVGGGWYNSASVEYTTIGGGCANSAIGYIAVVSGGYANSASGSYSSVAGGREDTSAALSSFTTNYGSKVPSGFSYSSAFNGQTASASGQLRCGALVGNSKSFQIDHPLDPNGKFLNHFSVESPKLLVTYDGVAFIGSDGRVVVNLPDYFSALTKDPRIQLTGVGTSDVYVAEDISGNQFVIGGKANKKVYWQVTAERKDVSAEITKILMPVEQEKTGELRGVSADDNYLMTTLDQLQEMGYGYKFNFRTERGRQRYDNMKRMERETEIRR